MITNSEIKLYLKLKMPRNLVKIIETKIYKKQDPYLEQLDKYQCIFIHVPKAGGSSVKEIIGINGVSHRTILDYEIFDQHKFYTYFKFAFVRNPWDRFLSAYTYLNELGYNQDRLLSAYKYLEKTGKLPYDKIWYDRYLSNYENFESFVNSLKDKRRARQILQGLHFRPQYQFICDYRLNIKVDFVGKLENINNDLKYITDKLGLSKKLIHLNQSSHRDYKEVYNKEMKQIVYDLYEKDIKKFDYSF